jgi:hypothetical protein
MSQLCNLQRPKKRKKEGKKRKEEKKKIKADKLVAGLLFKISIPVD